MAEWARCVPNTFPRTEGERLSLTQLRELRAPALAGGGAR
jgi:hypothetical protein